MFKNGEVFNPGDLYKVDIPTNFKDKQEERAVKLAAKLLISKGIMQLSPDLVLC